LAEYSIFIQQIARNTTFIQQIARNTTFIQQITRNTTYSYNKLQGIQHSYNKSQGIQHITNTLKIIQYLLNKSITELAVLASRPVVGSSKNSTGGEIISSIPMLVLFLSPPDTPRKNSFPT
jgi:hypothetical protein